MFRDTTHGFLAWAIATLIGVVLLAAAASATLGAGGRAVETVVSGAAQGATQASLQSSPSSNSVDASSPFNAAYYVDLLFRRANPSASGASTSEGTQPNEGARAGANQRDEASRILLQDLVRGDLTPGDRTYLAQIIASQSGLSQADAEKRVDDVVTEIKNAEAKVREGVGKARKASASASIVGALAMIVGAFIASVAAALGGRRRDEF